MKYTFTSVTIKSPDWKIVDAIDMTGIEIKDASVNRVDKKGTTWMAFDSIVEGGSVEADLWRNDAGKAYLFSPKPAKPSTGHSGASSGGSRGVAAAQTRKGEMIEKSMDRKEMGIQVSAAMRDATLITLASLKNEPFPTDADFGREFRKYRDWYMKMWQDTEAKLDVPFKSAPRGSEDEYGPGKGENGDWSNQD